MLAKLYHAHHTHYQEDIPFWQRLAGDVETVLELGCGTGRVTIPLARAGFSVWGIDWDESMLGEARLNLGGEPLPVRKRVSLIQADMTELHLETQFGAAILACNTFSTLRPIERKSVLAGMVEHLTRAGTFAVSVPNPTLLASLPQGAAESAVEGIFPHPQTGNPVQASSANESVEDGVIWRWHYDHLLPDGQVERSTMSTKHYYVPVEVYVSEMREAGLRLGGLYGDFEKGAYTSESQYLILVAKKIA